MYSTNLRCSAIAIFIDGMSDQLVLSKFCQSEVLMEEKAKTSLLDIRETDALLRRILLFVRAQA